jgi:hypothetical protein
MKFPITILTVLIIPQLAVGNSDGLFKTTLISKFRYCSSDTSVIISDSSYSRKWVIWYTPCKVEEINGVALSFGFVTENIKNSSPILRDSLLIRGLNLQINPLSVILIPYFLLIPNMDGEAPTSISFYDDKKHLWRTKIHGINMGINTLESLRISGLNITGAITLVDELHGISISGISNFSYIMNGLSIAGIRNRATRANGVQIGIYNKATSLRGIQIGLWNVNPKRKLPFLNWQFKE